MSISAELVRKLREMTGVGIMECKRALEEAKGDLETAVSVLRKRGLSAGAKKAGRETKEGVIGTYVHNDKIGVMVEVNCETDFVARNAEFQNLVHDIALHIAAADPRYARREDIAEETLEKEREIFREQARASGKPEGILDKIVEGRIAKFYAETCLPDQPFIRDDKITVRDLIAEHIHKMGENIQVRRFIRYKLGE